MVLGSVAGYGAHAIVREPEANVDRRVDWVTRGQPEREPASGQSQQLTECPPGYSGGHFSCPKILSPLQPGVRSRPEGRSLVQHHEPGLRSRTVPEGTQAAVRRLRE